MRVVGIEKAYGGSSGWWNIWGKGFSEGVWVDWPWGLP